MATREELDAKLTAAMAVRDARMRRLALARQGLSIVRTGVEALQSECDASQALVRSLAARLHAMDNAEGARP